MTRFVDISGAEPPGEPDYWEPMIFPAADIRTEIERLAAIDPPDGGRRESLLVHPRSVPAAPALAPGIRVTLAVLLPGERTRPIRHTSTLVGFCIGGTGHAVIDGARIPFEEFDAWNHPAWRTYWFENTGDRPQVRLMYSNAPMLERLNVHLVEDNPPEESVVSDVGTAGSVPIPPFALDGGPAMLMPYETLINPPSVLSHALHWPWAQVKAHLDRLDALGEDYAGRRLYLLYNPVTGRTNGTTPSFFATITLRPPGIVDRPHRHVSAAINYFFSGSGWSRIGGRRYEWAAGDLMLTAPGWMIHHHASDANPVYELTVQDQPLHIGMESLLWQEDLKRPARVLGSEKGFSTNR
jgi:gentisate 1,2-dioxygenase